MRCSINEIVLDSKLVRAIHYDEKTINQSSLYDAYHIKVKDQIKSLIFE